MDFLVDLRGFRKLKVDLSAKTEILVARSKNRLPLHERKAGYLSPPPKQHKSLGMRGKDTLVCSEVRRGYPCMNQNRRAGGIFLQTITILWILILYLHYTFFRIYDINQF